MTMSFISLPPGFNPILPEVYQIEATNHCNMNCANCMRQTMQRDRGYLDPELITIMGERGDFENSYFVELQMYGEPLLNNKLEEIIILLKKYNVKVGFSTNGILIPKRLDLISRLDYITVSLDSFDDYEKYRDGNKIDTLLNSLDLIFTLDSQPHVDLQCINFGDGVEKSMKIIGEIAKERGWSKYLIRSVDDCFLGFRGNRDIDCKDLCLNPWMSVSLHWNGDVVPCGFSYDDEIIYGNLYENSLKDVWASERVEKLRRQHLTGNLPDICQKCYTRSPTLLHWQLMMNWIKKEL